MGSPAAAESKRRNSPSGSPYQSAEEKGGERSAARSGPLTVRQSVEISFVSSAGLNDLTSPTELNELYQHTLRSFEPSRALEVLPPTSRFSTDGFFFSCMSHAIGQLLALSSHLRISVYFLMRLLQEIADFVCFFPVVVSD